MRLFAFVLIVLLLGAGATYALLNLDERVDIHLPGIVLRGQPQALLVFASLAVGAVVTGLLGLADGARLRFANRRLRREIHLLRQQGLDLLHPSSGGGPQGSKPPHAGSREASGRGRAAAADTPSPHPVIPSAAGGLNPEDEPPYGM